MYRTFGGGKTRHHMAEKVFVVGCRFQALLRTSAVNGRHQRNASIVVVARGAPDVLPLGHDDQGAPVKELLEHGGHVSHAAAEGATSVFSRFIVYYLRYVSYYWWIALTFRKQNIVCLRVAYVTTAAREKCDHSRTTAGRQHQRAHETLTLTKTKAKTKYRTPTFSSTVLRRCLRGTSMFRSCKGRPFVFKLVSAP